MGVKPSYRPIIRLLMTDTWVIWCGPDRDGSGRAGPHDTSGKAQTKRKTTDTREPVRAIHPNADGVVILSAVSLSNGDSGEGVP